MSKLYVLQTGQTTWEAQERIESAGGAPLTDQGLEEVAASAQSLREAGIGVLYAAGEAERETAECVAREVGVKVRFEDDLRELDYGLWQGLTFEEVRRRHPKLYRQWAEAPASVRPPGGETLAEARERLRSVLREIVKRHKGGAALVVLRPVMRALVACLAQGTDLEDLWHRVERKSPWDLYEMDGVSL